MFDIGWPEMLFVLVLALIVIGPKDLPHAMHGLGRMVRKLRNMSRAFQDSLDELVREAEIEDIKKQAQAAQQMIEDIEVESELQDLIDVERELDMDEGYLGPAAGVDQKDKVGEDVKSSSVEKKTSPKSSTPKSLPEKNITEKKPGVDPAVKKKGAGA